jgi:lipoprotein-anchoring transpeptidase ErfK/SrfK
MKIIITFFIVLTFLFSQPRAINMTVFEDNGIIKNFKGRPFVVVCVREKNSEGRIFLVNEFGECVADDIISSGAYGHRTPLGIHRITWKKRFHMSTKYPEPSGINNMDYSLFFTPQGHALHLGNVNAMSHGCIHVRPFMIQELFYQLDAGTPVIVMKGYYSPKFIETLSLF